MSDQTLGQRVRARDTNHNVVPGVYERVGKLQICWTGTDGRTHWRTLPAGTTLTQARKAREAERVDTDRGEAVPPSRATLRDVWDDYRASCEGRVLSGELSDNTVRRYAQLWKSHISPTLGTKRVQSITGASVARLLEDLRRKGLSPWTVRGVYRVLNSVLGLAVTRDLLPRNPMTRLARWERPKAENQTEARVLSPDAIQRLIASATPTLRTAIAVQANTALRLSELLGLVWDDIDRKAGVIRVRFQLDRNGRPKRVRLKTKRSARDVKVIPEVDRLLAAHRLAAPAAHSSGKDFVFVSESGGPLQQRNYARALRNAGKKAGLNVEGLPPVSSHDLRHSCIKRWVTTSGLDLVTLAEPVGDTVTTMLEKYGHPEDNHERVVSGLAAAGIGSA